MGPLGSRIRCLSCVHRVYDSQPFVSLLGLPGFPPDCGLPVLAITTCEVLRSHLLVPEGFTLRRGPPTGVIDYGAQYRACMIPCQRFERRSHLTRRTFYLTVTPA